MNINGVSLVVEKDGTRLDDDEELVFVKGEPILLLGKDEIWISEESALSSARSLSTATTVTVSSCNDSETDFEGSLNEVDRMPLVIVDHNSEIFWQQFDIWSTLHKKELNDLEKGNTLI